MKYKFGIGEKVEVVENDLARSNLRGSVCKRRFAIFSLFHLRFVPSNYYAVELERELFGRDLGRIVVEYCESDLKKGDIDSNEGDRVSADSASPVARKFEDRYTKYYWESVIINSEKV